MKCLHMKWCNLLKGALDFILQAQKAEKKRKKKKATTEVNKLFLFFNFMSEDVFCHCISYKEIKYG